ncbi:hypothetical protein SAMN05216474_1727 [Lishizhenia tianjinensis]|uniref:Long-chain fatty acid transport protein n=1 Tax=Lishizhenia tianjinensis TaxID=477690 RepID=A0A1I6ZYF4_9FLAO|nr:hypothetical protein [Lishizhenia tianjinensis]SFT67681.1 hypothetical protein SAMN05216474_1727 [Lishizhenia tianjinensis]
MRNNILVLIAVCLAPFLRAQTNASSPYSSLGVGETSFFGGSYFQSLGGASVAIIDSSQTNFYNPSSYASIAKGLPLFSMGVDYRSTTLTDGVNEGNLSYGNITHFSLVIPFADRFGLGFGIRPFSRVGYDVNDAEVVNGDSIFYEYKGSGGIQQVFGGLSANLIATKKHVLGVGVNGNFLFGYTQNYSRAYRVVSTSEIGSYIDDRLNYRGYTYDLGLNYSFKPNSKHKITIGATYTPSQQISVAQNRYDVFFTSYNNTGTYDTLYGNPDVEGTTTLASSYKLGFTYSFTPELDSTKSRRLKPEFLLTAEYNADSWSEYSRTLGGVADVNTLFDASSYRVGFQYRPHRIAAERKTVANYFERMSYRVGIYSSTLPMAVNGTQLSEFGTSFGLGLPVVLNRAVSSINLGVTYGQRGNGNINTIQENFWGINFGVNLSPGYDRWFRKYKYD